MKGIIYKATNTLNGKVYIGQTRVNLQKRRSQHIRDSRNDDCNLFHTALYQYPGVFEWEVVESFCGETEQVIHALNVAEEYHILKCKSTDPRYGYNATQGGYSSDKFADHISRQLAGRNSQAKNILQYDRNGDFLREFASQNEVAAYLGIRKFRIGEAALSYGYQWRPKTNEYYPRKIGAYVAPKKPTRQVLVYDKEGNFVKRFDSAKEAFRQTGAPGTIRPVVASLTIHEWQAREFYFFDNAQSFPDKIQINVIPKKKAEKKERRIRVAAYSLDGAFLREYDSIHDAANATKSSRSLIKRMCRTPEPIILGPTSQRTVLWRLSDGNPKPKIQVIDHRAKYVEKMAWRLQPDGTKKQVPVVMTERRAKEHYQKMEHRIIQYSLDGKFIKVWDNAKLASEATGEPYSAIYKQLGGGSPTKKAKNLWRYFADDYPLDITPPAPQNQEDTNPQTESAKKEREADVIYELDRAGNIIAEYNGTRDAAQKSGTSQGHVCNILSGLVRHPKHRFIRRNDYQQKYPHKQ